MDAIHSIFHATRRPSSLRRALPLATAALAAAAFFFAGCGKGGGSIVGREPIKAVVEVENNVGALRAWAMNGAKASALVHIDFLDDLTVFSAGQMAEMEDAARALGRRDVAVLDKIGPAIERGGTVSLGFMAGMYKRVVWVVPSVRPVSENTVDVYRNFLIARRRIPAAALIDFKVEGACITGSVAGVPLTITRLADLTLAAGEDAIIDIDLSYFPAQKLEDPAYRVGTKTLLEFLRELGGRGVKANLVTVNLSTGVNAVNVDLRFYGDVIREALAKTDDLAGAMPPKWRYMIQAEDSLVARRYASAEAIYGDLVAKEREDAGLYFSLALVQGLQNKGPECRASLLNAHRIDHEYLKGFFQLARMLADAGKVEAGLAIIDAPELQNIMPSLELDYQRGVFYYAAHRPAEAIKLLNGVAQSRPQDFGLFTVLFRAYREARNDRGKLYSLQKLVDIDDGRVRREMPWVYADLGDLYAEGNQYANAQQMYEKYMQAHPGDSLSTAFRKKLDAWKAKKLIAP